MKLNGATWDEAEVYGTLSEGAGGGEGSGVGAPGGPSLSLKMLGSFALKGVSKNAVLAQALPEALAAVRIEGRGGNVAQGMGGVR